MTLRSFSKNKKLIISVYIFMKYLISLIYAALTLFCSLNVLSNNIYIYIYISFNFPQWEV